MSTQELVHFYGKGSWKRCKTNLKVFGINDAASPPVIGANDANLPPAMTSLFPSVALVSLIYWPVLLLWCINHFQWTHWFVSCCILFKLPLLCTRSGVYVGIGTFIRKWLRKQMQVKSHSFGSWQRNIITCNNMLVSNSDACLLDPQTW